MLNNSRYKIPPGYTINSDKLATYVCNRYSHTTVDLHTWIGLNKCNTMNGEILNAAHSAHLT
jgi:hypothetical protein